MGGTKTLHIVFTVVFTYQCILLDGALLHETFVQNSAEHCVAYCQAKESEQWMPIVR